VKLISRSFIIAALLIASASSYAQTLPASYEIGTWPHFCSAAVSYTFDDNCPNQLAIAVPMFNEYGFPMTLFTVTSKSWGWQANWAGLQAAALKGHEIASHTVSHNSLSSSTTPANDSLQRYELSASRDTINARITGQQCVTIAYPNCVTGINAVVQQYYFAARICSGVIEPKTPNNYMGISSFVCGDAGATKTGADFKARLASAASSKGWVVYLIHGINGTESGAYSPIKADTIRVTLDYLKANTDKFWVATFANAARYARERNAATLTETSVQDTVIALTLTDTLDNALYNMPVTFRRPLPTNWISATGTQKGKVMNTTVVDISGTKYIVFDAMPDGGDILLVKSTVTAVGRVENTTPSNYFLGQNYPNPFNPDTDIRYQISTGTQVSLKVFDTVGKEVAMLVNGFKEAGMYTVKFSAQNTGLQSGIYFYHLEAGKFSDTKKMTLLK
jgi:peptidoglycan/xylan/chitin deacetylase (PgdA/CDA1 family)